MISDADFPANVHALKPRKISLTEKLDRFLDEHGLEPSEAPKRYDLSRPKKISGNALVCVACGEVEYLTRDYCRCGHYLRGQLEDEFLAWEHKLHLDHDTLANDIALKLRPFRLFILLGIGFLIVPLLQLCLWPDSFVFSSFLWFCPAFLTCGLAALVEQHLSRPLKVSALHLENYTFLSFLSERHQLHVENIS